MSVVRLGSLRLLVLGAGVALVASCGSAVASRPSVDVHPAGSAPSAIATDQNAVERLIHRLRSRGEAFEPAAEWSSGRLILAVAHPTAGVWPRLAGRVVGGLEVTVLKARVTTRDYERAIPAIGRASFPDSDRVVSFDYPPDGSLVIVRVRDLSDMGDARRSALTANLERVAHVPVQLVTAPRLVPLTYTLRQ
jgi:hypothetical protein